jgi:enoyl-CoA hydratase/carnithine racemase
VDYREIRFDCDQGVATITLACPERRNAFSSRMGSEWSDAYRRCDSDDAVRAVVVTGSGDAFCAGADLSSGEATFARRDSPGFSASPLALPAWEVRKPVIAAMNGHAIGLGLTLALQCDLRIAARDARYGIVQVRRGVMPDAYAHWTLQRLVGIERAAWLLLTGTRIRGSEAAELGLALRAVPAAEVLPAALEIAREIAREGAPLSVAICKRLLWQSASLTPAETLRRETELHHHLMGRPDSIEGVMAYLERREPRFTSSVARDWPADPADRD